MRISDLSSDLCSSDLEGDDVLADRVDVALLAAGLGPHRLALGHAQHLGGEQLSRALVGTNHRPAAAHGAGVEAGALLRSEERRVGQECVSTCRIWWDACHEKEN